MASLDYGGEEKAAESIVQHSDKSDNGVLHLEKQAEQTAHDAAERGHAATDRFVPLSSSNTGWKFDLFYTDMELPSSILIQ